LSLSLNPNVCLKGNTGEIEATGILPSLNIKTARSWRGILALRTSHGRGV